MNSSDMPSAKYSLAGSPLELTSGSTAIDFSGAALFVRCRKKNTPAASKRRSNTAMTMTSCHGIRFALAGAVPFGAETAAATDFSFSGGSGLPSGSA
jgi:hypothetical protein